MLTDTTAVILCGGKGERLRPFTDHLPKPLVPLKGRPILEHLMRYLEQFGVRQYILCTGYKAECIEHFVQELNDPAINVRCINSGDVDMTRRLRDAWPHTKKRVLVCYGDTLANVDLNALALQHDATGAAATMAVYRPQNPFGVVRFDRQGKVRAFVEKPRMSQWINIGFLLCNADTVGPLLAGATDMIGFLSMLADSESLGAFRHNGKHLTINTEKERQQAETEVVEFFSLAGDYINVHE